MTSVEFNSLRCFIAWIINEIKNTMDAIRILPIVIISSDWESSKKVDKLNILSKDKETKQSTIPTAIAVIKYDKIAFL